MLGIEYLLIHKKMPVTKRSLNLLIWYWQVYMEIKENYIGIFDVCSVHTLLKTHTNLLGSENEGICW